MNDIFNRIKQSHREPSTLLSQAQAILSQSLSDEDKYQQIETLAKQAPSNEREQFGDLLSNLILRSDSNGG
jgi:hypothetical protein